VKAPKCKVGPPAVQPI